MCTFPDLLEMAQHEKILDLIKINFYWLCVITAYDPAGCVSQLHTAKPLKSGWQPNYLFMYDKGYCCM
jgi:hypothetical protein